MLALPILAPRSSLYITNWEVRKSPPCGSLCGSAGWASVPEAVPGRTPAEGGGAGVLKFTTLLSGRCSLIYLHKEDLAPAPHSASSAQLPSLESEVDESSEPHVAALIPSTGIL